MKPSTNSSARVQTPLPVKGNGGTVAGVHIAQGCIRLAISRKGVIRKYQSIALSPNMVLYSPEFELLLGNALRDFFKGYGHLNIWATAPFDGFSIRNLNIPKVPKNKLSHAVRWALQMEKTGSLNDTFVDYVVGDDVVVKGVRKIAVTACSVGKNQIDDLCKLFANIGFPLTGLTVPHFTLNGVVGACRVVNKNHDDLVLDIGMNSSRILLYSHGKLVLNREFKLGVNAFLDACMGEVPAENGAETFLAQLADPEETDTNSISIASSRESIVDAFQPVLARLMRKYELTLEAGAININEIELQNIYLSGPLCACCEVRGFISAYVDLPVIALNPLDAPCLSLAQAEACPLVKASWFMPAVGLALADNAHTLNVLSPVQSTFELAQHRNLNQIILSAFIIVALAMGTAWWWLGSRVLQLQQDAVNLEQRVVDDALDVDALRPVVDAVIDQNKMRSKVVRDRLVLALIKEITTLTCGKFQLIEIDFRMASVARKAGVALSGDEDVIHLKGRIYGKHTEQASILAACQIKLDESPLLSNIVIKENATAIYANSTVLEFYVTLTPQLSSRKKGGANDS